MLQGSKNPVRINTPDKKNKNRREQKMEKRKMKELEILDDKGMLDYTIIPNYKMKEEFITENELKLYKVYKE